MKKVLPIIFIALSINNLFSLEIRTSKIQTGFNKQGFSTFSVIDLFYTEVAKDQLDDIINGDTVLKFDAAGSEVAQT